MAYSDSPITLQRMLADIQPLIQGASSAVWQTRPGKARRQAFKLWEAIRLARINGIAIPKYKISVVSDIHVKATLREEDEAILVDVEGTSEPAFVDVRQVSLDGWLDSIRAAWDKRGVAEKVYMPRARPNRAQLEELFTWAQSVGVIFFENEGALTLMTLEGNEDAAEFSWNPTEED